MIYEEDRAAIRRLGEEWSAAMRAKDVDRLLTLVTDDVVIMPSNMPSVVGKNAVGEMLRAFFACFLVDRTITPEEVQVGGDRAFARWRDSLTLRLISGGPPISVQARGVSILHRDTDGTWRFARSITNTAPGAPGDAPKDRGQ
jgi:uncharacterized protein (TIGR02246 family)